MKACYVFIFAAAFLALANADESSERKIPERLKKVLDECKEQKDTPFALCRNHKLGIQSLNGDIDKDALKTSLQKIPHITAEKVDKLVTECGEKKGATAGEAATALDECIRKNVRPEGHPEGHAHGRPHGHH